MSSDTASTSIGGTNYYYQTSGAADAIVQQPGGSLQFTVHPGDKWVLDPVTANRSEIASGLQIANGTPVHVAYNMAVQSGAVDPNPGNWAVLGQFHQNDGPNTPHNSPPFSIGIVSGKMQVAIGYTDAVAKDTSRVIWSDPNTIVQGATYAMDVKATFDPNGNGHLTVSRNGVTLVDYAGPLGYVSQSSVYWKEGIYRGASNTTMVASYADLSVDTGTTSNSLTARVSDAGVSGFQRSSTTTDYDGTTGNVTGTVVRYVSTDSSQTLEKQFNASGTLVYQQQLGLDGSKTTMIYGSDRTLQQSTALHADGSIDSAQYGLTNKPYVSVLTHQDGKGAITWQQEVFADGSKIIADHGDESQGYVTKTTFVNAAGVQTSVVYSNQDGSCGAYSYATGGCLTQVMLTAKDGTQTTTTYSVTGIAQQSKTVNTDGSKLYTSYDATGVKTGTFLSSPDGSSEVDSYAANGILTQSIVTAKDGTQTSGVYGSNGIIQQTKVVHTDGSKLYTSYDATGVKTGTFLSRPDGSSEVDSYAASGILTQSIVTAKDGTQTSGVYGSNGIIQQTKVVHTNGDKDYTSYNAAGLKTSTFFGHADGSSETDVFAGNGALTQKILLAKDGTQTIDTYGSNGVIQGGKVVHTDGSKDYINFDAAGNKTSVYYGHLDGSSETDVFAVNGTMTQRIITAKDGTQSTDSYSGNGTIQLSKAVHTDGSKDYTNYDAAGHKTSTYYSHVDGSSQTDVFASSGAMTQQILVAKNGTQTTDTYALNGSLEEMKMINADGSRVYMDYNVGGYSSIMTSVSAAGAPTAMQQVKPDGTAAGKAFAAGVSLVSQAGSDTFTSYHNDTFVFHQGFGNDTINGFNGAGGLRDVVQLDKSLVADFSHVNMTQSGANTLITVSPHDSITLKGVNVSTLSAGNFNFV